MVAEKTAGSILPALCHPTEGFLRPRLAFMGEEESRRTPGSFATEEPAVLATGTDTHSLCHPGSLQSFHGLIAHPFLALNTILLSRCITVYLSISLLKDILLPCFGNYE